MAQRSLLFVPGSRPDRFEKALAASADLICIDLEDAVSPDQKESARSATCDWLTQRDDISTACVRINPPGTDLGSADLDALAKVPGLSLLMIPKVTTPDQVEAVATRFPTVRLIALIESPVGVIAAPAIAAARGVTALMFGGADFSAEMGCEMTWEPLLAARGQLALAAASCSIGLIDVPYLDVTDNAGLEQETRAVRSMGFTAKAAIHPAQVSTINAVFSPSPAQLEWARSVVDAVGGDENLIAVVNGKFIDRPVILQARHILAQSD
ncbi:MAG: CoA ester lyase [Pseudomonadota bacterium]